MKKNAFTLSELLGVIVILAALALLILPTVTNMTKKSRDKAHEEQKIRLIDASKKWALDNLNLLSENDTTIVKLDTLINSGFLSEKDIVDPRNSSVKLQGCIKIEYTQNYSQYQYEYNDNCN